MILLAIIVQSEDAGKLADRLVDKGFRLTRLNAKGGFLATGSSVLLVGVADDRLSAVTEVIEATCHTRTRLINAAPYPGMAGVYAMGTVAPVEVLIGGAVVFGVPVEHHLRLGGAAAPPFIQPIIGDESTIDPNAMHQAAPAERMSNVTSGTDSASDPTAEPAAQSDAAPPFDTAAPGTKLVVAIVQKENSDAVVNALMDAGYRLTRIDTAGGFLRRGNATLLIGVESSRLNDVLSLIHANCQPRSEPNPIQQGMPMYGATVFVTDASHYLRF